MRLVTVVLDIHTAMREVNLQTDKQGSIVMPPDGVQSQSFAVPACILCSCSSVRGPLEGTAYLPCALPCSSARGWLKSKRMISKRSVSSA